MASQHCWYTENDSWLPGPVDATNSYSPSFHNICYIQSFLGDLLLPLLHIELQSYSCTGAGLLSPLDIRHCPHGPFWDTANKRSVHRLKAFSCIIILYCFLRLYLIIQNGSELWKQSHLVPVIVKSSSCVDGPALYMNGRHHVSIIFHGTDVPFCHSLLAWNIRLHTRMTWCMMKSTTSLLCQRKAEASHAPVQSMINRRLLLMLIQ